MLAEIRRLTSLVDALNGELETCKFWRLHWAAEAKDMSQKLIQALEGKT